MRKITDATLTKREETAEELIGVLTAISVVSKRLAKKLAMLENPPLCERSEQPDGQSKAVYSHAD